jgi:hypothetical protein
LEETSNTDISLVRKPEKKRPLRKPKRRWEDNIKMNLRKQTGVWTAFLWLRIETGGGFL